MTKVFPKSTPNEEILKDFRRCKAEVRDWGAQNRVSLDAGREEFTVTHHIEGQGEVFRLLKPVFDAKLLMHTAVQTWVGRARPKTQAHC